MALSIVNNSASLNAQHNLNASSTALSKSLERLSTGLKINRGADAPAGLVISEQQRAQIAGLTTAIDNTNKAVSLVQTAEGSLNEINSLLVKARGLALDSANSGVNDATAQAANQAEITNILSSIDNISATTKFGTKALLNGAANNGALTSLQSGVTVTGSLATIPVSGQKLFSYTTTAAVAASTTGAGAFAVTANGTFTVNTATVANLVTTDTVDTAVTKINAGFAAQNLAFTASNVGGALKISATNNKFDVAIGGTGTFTNAPASASRTAATLTYTNSAGTAVTSTATATAAVTTTAGPDAGVITLTGELNGAIVDLGKTASVVAPASQKLQVGEQLSFQIGANAGETSTLSIARVGASSIGLGADPTYTSLSTINVTTTTGAQAAISVIDQAISDISSKRGTLGAFQSNTLESNARSLTTTLENTKAAESIIRDTDFSSEIANFTRLQTQVQAGATVLGNANQTSQLVAQLLRA